MKVVDCSRVIWLGDLNYRLSLSELETWKLVKLSDWESLIKLDEVYTFYIYFIIYMHTEYFGLITIVLQISYNG